MNVWTKFHRLEVGNDFSSQIIYCSKKREMFLPGLAGLAPCPLEIEAPPPFSENQTDTLTNQGLDGNDPCTSSP